MQEQSPARPLTLALLWVLAAWHKEGLTTPASISILDAGHCTLLLAPGGLQVQLGNALQMWEERGVMLMSDLWEVLQTRRNVLSKGCSH